MLLKLLRTRLMHRLGRDEQGIALPAILGVMVVVAIVVLAVGGASVSAAGFASSTRASVSARAAAYGGIEAVFADIYQSDLVCAVSSTDPRYRASIVYKDASGTALDCGGAEVSGTPATAIITSTGTGHGSLNATAASSITLNAEIELTGTSGGVSLTNAIFSDGDLAFQNNDNVVSSDPSVVDADIYTNGRVTCGTSGTAIEGTIYSQSTLSFQNANCVAYGTVWANGDVNVTNSAVFKGSIYSTGAVDLENAVVYGNVIANNAATLGRPSLSCTDGTQANVCGTVYSLSGGINAPYGAYRVMNSIYARGNIAMGINPSDVKVGHDVTSLSGSISGKGQVSGAVNAGGTIGSDITSVSRCAGVGCTLVLPATTSANQPFNVQLPMFDPANSANLGTRTSTVRVQPPPPQQMPVVTNSLTPWSGAGWSVVTPDSSMCSMNNETNSINTYLTNHPQAHKQVLFNLSNCTGGVSSDNQTVLLSSTVNDVALLVPYGFRSTNSLTIKSSDGAPHEFMVIAPAPSPTSTACPSTPNESLDFGTGFVTSNGAQTFIYSPCQVSMAGQNGGTLTGQIYAGRTSFPVSFTIVMPKPANIPVIPGMTNASNPTTNPTSGFAITVDSLYQVTG